MALGAAGREIIGMVLKQGMILASVGLTIGILASVALSRFVARLLFGIAATDPAVFGTVSLILVAVALFACYIPARRATRIDPLAALRME
jgi:ABC-type antimicrobial peptide transport system permease subunit